MLHRVRPWLRSYLESVRSVAKMSPRSYTTARISRGADLVVLTCHGRYSGLQAGGYEAKASLGNSARAIFKENSIGAEMTEP